MTTIPDIRKLVARELLDELRSSGVEFRYRRGAIEQRVPVDLSSDLIQAMCEHRVELQYFLFGEILFDLSRGGMGTLSDS